jgi:DNA-binding NarL/FixJ family response regulator
VGEAGHGLEAIAMATELRHDVILMDAQMPRMDGVETTHFTKRRMPGIKVLFLTVLLEYREAAADAGADDFLLKDSGRDELLRAIRRLGHAA